MEDASNIYLSVCGAGRSLGYVCAPSLMQQVIARCLDAKVNVEAYKANRDLLYNGLSDCGFDCVKPDGAFYLWMRALEPDAQAFSDKARSHELLVVPSDSFGVGGWVRISYCVAEEVITGSRDAFAALKADYE
jgi:aspartate aminotransferase